MPKHNFISFAAGVSATFTDLLGNGYVDTAIKGVLGGVFGYLGKLVVVWLYKKGKEYLEK